MLSYLVSLLGGGALTLAFAPFNITIIAIISIAALVYTLDEQTNLTAFFLGYLWGYGFNFTSLYWIVNALNADIEKFGWLYYPALLAIPAVISVYYGIMALAFTVLVRWIDTEYYYIKPIVFACVWLTQELIRENLIIPWGWNHLGYSVIWSTELSQIANFIGVKGISFIIAFLGNTPVALVMYQSFYIL